MRIETDWPPQPAGMEGGPVSVLARALTATALPFGVSITDLKIGAAAQLLDTGTARFSANVAAQCAAALQTAALVLRTPKARLLLVLADDGEARACENLLYSEARDQIDPVRVLAAVTLAAPGADGAPSGEDVIVMWIDDISQVDDAHYDPRFRSWRFRRLPLLDDALVQRENDRTLAGVLAGIRAQRDAAMTPTVRWPPRPARTDAPVILFCLYWLDFGGAEAFAIQSITAAKAAGYRVVVTTDEVGRHRVIEKLDGIADAIYLLGSCGFGLSRDHALLRVLELHRPDILHIHHSWTAYRQLGTFRALGLVDRVIDFHPCARIFRRLRLRIHPALALYRLPPRHQRAPEGAL